MFYFSLKLPPPRYTRCKILCVLQNLGSGRHATNIFLLAQKFSAVSALRWTDSLHFSTSYSGSKMSFPSTLLSLILSLTLVSGKLYPADWTTRRPRREDFEEVRKAQTNIQSASSSLFYLCWPVFSMPPLPSLSTLNLCEL